MTPQIFNWIHFFPFRNKPKLIARYNGLLQIGLAVVQALEFVAKNPLDQVSATEKALLQYLINSPENVLDHIMQMVYERDLM